MGFQGATAIFQRYDYIQATEPADLRVGVRWYNTSTNTLLVSNGTSFEAIGGVVPTIQEIITSAGEFTEISADDLGGFTHAKIKMYGQIDDTIAAGQTHSRSFNFQSKEIGGSYANITSGELATGQNQNAGIIQDDNILFIEYTHELTSGELTNGVQFKINISGSGSTFTFKQAVLELW